MNIFTHERILGLAALTLFGTALIAAGCGSSRKATGTKPSGVSGGEVKGGFSVADGTADGGACTAEEEGLCVCVPGGFEFDGSIYDFACCFSEAIYVISCGDDATCNPDTFACDGAVSGEGGSSEGGSGEGGSTAGCADLGDDCGDDMPCCGEAVCSSDGACGA